MEEGITNINDLYLLMNRTFASLEGDLTNLEFKIMTLMMIKTQKKLLQTYGECTKDVIKNIPHVIPCSFSVDELRQFKDRRNNITLKKISECFSCLNDKKINFISAIDGGYVYSHFISEFKISEDNKKITALISREVFLFLLDYNGNFDYKKNFPHDKEIRKETKNIDYRKKGYSKQLFKNTNDIKNYYTQALNYRFRLALDSVCLRAKAILPCEVTYSLDQIRAYCGCVGKYARYGDLKDRIIKPALKELRERKLFNVEFIPESKNIKGGKKVHSITFKIEAGEVTRKEIEESFKYNNVVKKANSYNSNKEDAHLDALADSLVNLLAHQSKIKLAVSTIQGFIDTYGENKVKRAVNITINASKEEKIMRPMRYIQRVLENIENNEVKRKENEGTIVEQRNYTSNNSKRLKQLKANGLDVMGFNNFEGREYDYDSLEESLISWYQSDEDDTSEESSHENYILRDIKSREKKDC